MNRLKNKIAVITGSSRGLGLAMAKAFAGEGASVVLASRSEAPIQKAADAVRAAFPGAQVAGAACDTSDMAQVEALGEYAVKTFGRLDVWVNNAGISPTMARRFISSRMNSSRRRRRMCWARTMARSWQC